MKVLYCIDSLISPGGTERVTTTKVNWLAEYGNVDVTLLSLYEDAPAFFQLSDKVNHICMHRGTTSKRKYKKELHDILSQIKPDVTVCVSGLATNLLPKMKDGSKKVLEFHYTKNYLVNFVKGIENLRFKNLHLMKMALLQWQLKRTSTKYDCFVGLTQRDVALWGNPKNMTYIYNPLSFQSERKSSCSNHKIIAVGSFTPAKGMDLLIRAFGVIAKRHADWTLDIYGSGQDEALLTRLINEYGIDSQVTLLEPCSDIKEKLIESSIYAFPSRSDGFGLVITEAMECGLPTVAMDCECGPREVLTPNCGILVSPESIVGFANAIERLMDNEALRIEMGENAQLRAAFFHPDNIMPQWQKLFDSLLTNGNGVS